MSVIETASAPACAAMRAAPRPHDRRLYVREGAGFIEAAPEDVFDIARELIAERFYPRALVLSDPDLVKLFFRLQLGPCTRQVFAAAYLNARRRLLGYVELSMGTVNQVEIYPRVAVREGLIRNATLVIFGRNDVCGISAPSFDDQSAYHRLRGALELVDIRVLDYLVIGETTASLNTARREPPPAHAPRPRQRRACTPHHDPSADSASAPSAA